MIPTAWSPNRHERALECVEISARWFNSGTVNALIELFSGSDERRLAYSRDLDRWLPFEALPPWVMWLAESRSRVMVDAVPGAAELLSSALGLERIAAELFDYRRGPDERFRERAEAGSVSREPD